LLPSRFEESESLVVKVEIYLKSGSVVLNKGFESGSGSGSFLFIKYSKKL
jgi:hypothetical protein